MVILYYKSVPSGVDIELNLPLWSSFTVLWLWRVFCLDIYQITVFFSE